MCSNQSDEILSLRSASIDVVPSFKRFQVSSPFVVNKEGSVTNQLSIEDLPDECLSEIFRRLPRDEEKSACACVSKRWLVLVSSIRGSEFCHQNSPESSRAGQKRFYKQLLNRLVSKWNEDFDVSHPKAGEFNTVEDVYLAKRLEGNETTDINLAAIGVGAASHCGIGKLSIHGSNHYCGVTDFGLKAVSHGCPSLRYLSLCHLPLIRDEGLVEIAKCCPLLETLRLHHCPGISDKAFHAIGNNCSHLTSLTIEHCSNIGYEGMKAVAKCPNLKSITISNCSKIRDRGIGRLFILAGNVLAKVTLEELNITYASFVLMSRCGSSLTDLILSDLVHVNERGFELLGKCPGLVNLRSFTVKACPGMTDIAIVNVVKGSPSLKKACLQKCLFVSDKGLIALAKAVRSLESVYLDECPKITLFGVFDILANPGTKLKTLELSNCFGLRDMVYGSMLNTPCNSLQSLSIRNCPGFGNAGLSGLASIGPNISNIELISLSGISDTGIILLVKSSDAGLVKVKLSGCVNVTDNVVSVIARRHGGILEVLELAGCQQVTDASLLAITDNCSVLRELDVSNSRITDASVIALAHDASMHESLYTLNLSGCSLLSNDIFIPLVILGGGSINYLNIKHCNGVSPDVVDMIVDHLWSVNVLY